MHQSPTGGQQAMSNSKRPREGETYEPYKRAQGLEYPDMGANVEDNAYPRRDTTQEMMPSLPSWDTGSEDPSQMDDPSIGMAMPIKNFGLDGSQGLGPAYGNLKQQQLRPQLQPVSWKANTQMVYDPAVPPPSVQVQPIYAAHAQTPHQAQVIQSSLPTPKITPRRKAKKKVPAGKSAQAGAPSAAPVAPGNGVYQFGLPNGGAQQIGQQTHQFLVGSPYVQQQTQAPGLQDGGLQQQTPLQQAQGQQQPPQQPVYGQQPPIGMYAPPKIASSKPPGARARSRQQQVPGMIKPQENNAKTVIDGRRGLTSPTSYEPFPQSIQSKWLARSWKHLTLPNLDVLPGISVQTRLAIGPEHELVIPVFVLQMRGMDAQGRLEAWMKITKLGRSFYALFPKDPRWKDVWEEILQFSQEMIKQERSFYRFVEKIDPAEKMRLFQERTLHVRVDPALVDPWNPQWTDPELSEFARQKPLVGVPAKPVDVFGSTTDQQGNYPRIPYAQDGSRADSPVIRQPGTPGWPSDSAHFQSPLMQGQSIYQPPQIATPPQAQHHAQFTPLAGQTPRPINPVPAVLGPLAPARKRKPRASKKDSGSNKKVQTNQGQGDMIQQEMAPWLQELEKKYLANQAEIDAYYMENNDLGMRSMNDDFSDKMRTWNGRKPSTSAQHEISNAVQQGPTFQVPFPEVEPARPGQYTAEEEMIAEGAAQGYIADLERGTVLPRTPSQMQSDAMPPRVQYAAPQAQKFTPNPSVQSASGIIAAQNLAAQGREQLQTTPVMQTGGLKQPIKTPVQQTQVPTPPIDTSPVVSQVPQASQAASPPVITLPQTAPTDQKKPSSVFNPTQEAQKTVYRQMLARNAALDKRLELSEADRIVVGGIDIAALLDAGTDMMKIIKQITPFMTDPALVIEPPIPETQQSDEALAQDGILPAVPPTFINAPEHGWNNVEIIDDSDVRFWPGMDNIYDVYLAELGRNAFAGETKAEREAWEAHVAAEYQREMEKLDEMFGKDTYYIGDW